MARHQDQAELLCELYEFLRLLRIGGERFLDEDVLACLQRLAGEPVVRPRRRRDRDGLDTGIGERRIEGSLDVDPRMTAPEFGDPFHVQLTEPE